LILPVRGATAAASDDGVMARIHVAGRVKLYSNCCNHEKKNWGLPP